MGNNHSTVDNTGEAASEFQGSGRSTGFENVKNTIADTFHTAAEAISGKEVDRDAQSGGTRCGKQASEWLDRSAGYIRQFDYEQAKASVREYVRQRPGRGLLIAGAVGLMIGTMLRRR